MSIYLSTVDSTVAQTYGHPSEALSNECAICLTVVEEDQEAILLPCRHRFHSECIHRWFDAPRDTCCVCRQRLDDPHAFMASQQLAQDKLAFMKRLYEVAERRNDVMHFRDTYVEPGYKWTTLVWEDVDLVAFEIVTDDDMLIDIRYELLERDLLALL